MALVLCAGFLLAGCVHTPTVVPDAPVRVPSAAPATGFTYLSQPGPWGDPVRRYSRSVGGAFVPWYPYPVPYFATSRFGFTYGWPWTASYRIWPGAYFPPGRWTYYPWYGWSPLAHAPWPGAWQAAALNDPRRVYEPPFQLESGPVPVAYARPVFRSENGQRLPAPHASGLRAPPGAPSTRLVEDYRAFRSPSAPPLNASAFRRPAAAPERSRSATRVRSAGQAKPGLSRTHASGFTAPSTQPRSTSRAGSRPSPASGRPRSATPSIPEH
ncbi:MAG: hypothetical protein V2I57_05030 [Xanthomonadales bacterium]|nr:hypothetical protein [Xanthomonadales bacterium]